MSEWQPIETAPRDGTWFIICRKGEDDFCEVGRYLPLMWDRYVEIGDGLYRKELKPLHEWSGFENFHRATHWTPIPAPLP